VVVDVVVDDAAVDCDRVETALALALLLVAKRRVELL
jgi:hypothetical protein